jgi:hypothetical protein
LYVWGKKGGTQKTKVGTAPGNKKKTEGKKRGPRVDRLLVFDRRAEIRRKEEEKKTKAI